MCWCVRSSTQEDKKSKDIDQVIKEGRKTDIGKMKLLLLGPGDAGKSTFLKQLTLIHLDGLRDTNKALYARMLQENCLTSMQTLLQCEHQDFALPKDLKGDADVILSANKLQEVATKIETLSKDDFIKNTFGQRGNFRIQIPCVSEYYWCHAVRFADENFVPTTEDIIRCRSKTLGIQTIDFAVENAKFTVIDVGGQRSERRKWLHCFDDVSYIIYLSAIDDYDMVLEEDEMTNRMSESLSLWSEVTASQFFQPLAWILFLNKYDVLKQKIAKVSLHHYFDDISEEDGQDFDKCVAYLTQKFDDNYHGKTPFYSFTTCALDTDGCQKVFYAVKDTIINKALEMVDLT